MKLSGTKTFILIMLIPLCGGISAFYEMKKKNQTVNIFFISLFSALMVMLIPPYQDLFRRFLETYNTYTYLTSYKDAISGHVDVVYYILTLTLKKMDIPFFYVSVIVVFSSIYNHLTALKLALNTFDDIDESKIKYYYFFYYCFINILIIALGIRMGWGVSFAILGVSFFYFSKRNAKSKGVLCLFIASLVHFSMIFILLILVLASFIKVSKKSIPLLLFISITFGNIFIPWLLSHFSFWGLSNYALSGYIDNDSFAETTDNLHQKIVNYYSYLMIALFLIVAFFNERESLRNYNSFLTIYLCACFLFSSFYIVFNRYFVEAGVYFYIISLLATNKSGFRKYISVFIIISSLNLMFSTLYLQRRSIMLGEMWKSLITPPVLYLYRDESDFESKLKYINDGGDWIGHELGR